MLSTLRMDSIDSNGSMLQLRAILDIHSDSRPWYPSCRPAGLSTTTGAPSASASTAVAAACFRARLAGELSPAGGTHGSSRASGAPPSTRSSRLLGQPWLTDSPGPVGRRGCGTVFGEAARHEGARARRFGPDDPAQGTGVAAAVPRRAERITGCPLSGTVTAARVDSSPAASTLEDRPWRHGGGLPGPDPESPKPFEHDSRPAGRPPATPRGAVLESAPGRTRGRSGAAAGGRPTR